MAIEEIMKIIVSFRSRNQLDDEHNKKNEPVDSFARENQAKFVNCPNDIQLTNIVNIKSRIWAKFLILKHSIDTFIKRNLKFSKISTNHPTRFLTALQLNKSLITGGCYENLLAT